MCPIRNVLFPCLARASMSVLLTAACLTVSAIAPQLPGNEVCDRTWGAEIGSRPSSTCVERGYCHWKETRRGGVGFRVSKGELKGKPVVRSQSVSVA